jgi:hypothetical protein
MLALQRKRRRQPRYKGDDNLDMKKKEGRDADAEE